MRDIIPPQSESGKVEGLGARRRLLLKLGFFGAAAFALGKIFGPSVPFLSERAVSSKDFKNFRIVETSKELRLFNKTGDEIVIVDKEGF